MKKLTLFSVLSAVTAVTSLSLACPGHEGGGRAKMDTNGDGKVTLDEMRAGAKERFTQLDTDKNGVLSQAEISKAPHGGRMIEHADANKDGQVTAAESQAAVDAFFKKLDKNNDGVLTAEERPGRGHHGDHDNKKS
ncbi:MAG: EF-hand domain-containing protein [Polyangiaceae bacterium]